MPVPVLRLTLSSRLLEPVVPEVVLELPFLVPVLGLALSPRPPELVVPCVPLASSEVPHSMRSIAFQHGMQSLSKSRAQSSYRVAGILLSTSLYL